MSQLRLPNLRALSIATSMTLTLFFSNLALQAKDPPSDACAMVPPGQLAKVLEQPYGPPAKTTAPPAQDHVTGTDCTYQSSNGIARKLLFRIYVDPSAAVAKDTFDKLSTYYGPNTAVTGNWDTAYLDSTHAIHIQKGKVRFYLNLNPIGTDTANAEKQLKALAAWVAGQL